ncbi:hypothetical protein CBR_g36317 [Chara braunii]|uniref:HAT C-terminal dimerisation domain-containing protein n=1 Tax=Chara braunii TaxID=69332 RepID=A0A388LKC7_CHABU|nr:hypothetical protein CBR_g36317 [Chara braunii]|eukprot:GBG82786.1 hypothetical protein CBR_g36317 [Chara braunii]
MEFQKQPARVATENVCTPEKAMKKRKDEHMWEQPAVDDVKRLDPATWWAAHGGDVPTLHAIAIKIMGMWSIATPAERNWASMDFIHTKRRHSLSPASLEKLVYIHWNMQLLRARHHKDNWFVDVWGSFFEPIMEPQQNDGSTLVTDTEDAAEKQDEEMRQRNMAKAPRNRIPKNLLDSDTSDSSDLEDMVWKLKCRNESSSEDCSEDEDSDFELGAVPAVPATTYVGRRTWRQDRDLEVESTPVVDTVDTDVEFLLHRHDDPDEEEATRAKEMADKDRELMDRRVAKEEPRRAAIVTRRERERRAAQQEKHGGEALKEMEGDVQPAIEKGEQQQGEPADAAGEQQAAVVVYMCRPRPCVEQEVGAEGETTDQERRLTKVVFFITTSGHPSPLQDATCLNRWFSGLQTFHHFRTIEV